MFEGFDKFDIQTSDPQVKIHGVIGGKGPPLLLLHGNPLTHVHWHIVAPLLAKDYTVVCADLRGYGDSGKPRGLPDHSNYTYRRMGQDQFDVMSHLGFDKFFLGGHDRGGRVGYRMALDKPERVLKLATFDIIPTHYILTHITREWAVNSYHWFFMAQPYDVPEKFFEGKERYYIDKKLTVMGIGKGGFTEETLAEYRRCCTAENLHAVCEDYRAGVTLDFEMDEADLKAGRKIQCPTLVTWGAKSHTDKWFDAREAWPIYAANIYKFCPLPCGHYPAEQVPEDVYSELSAFLKT